MEVKTYQSNQKWLDSNENPIVLKLSYTDLKVLAEVFLEGNFDKDKDIKFIFASDKYLESPKWLEIFSETKNEGILCKSIDV